MNTTVTYRVTGTSPLLMHSPASMSKAKDGGPKAKHIPTPEEEAEAGAYRMADRQLYFPATGFRSSLVSGGKGRKIGKSFATTLLAATVFETTIAVPLIDPTTKEPLFDFLIDTRRAVVQRQGISRSRPLLGEWEGLVEFEYDTDFLKVDWISEVFEVAGKIVGVGDYRPEKRGRFGRYSVELV